MPRSSITETNQFLVLDAIRSAGATTRPALAADLAGQVVEEPEAAQGWPTDRLTCLERLDPGGPDPLAGTCAIRLKLLARNPRLSAQN